MSFRAYPILLLVFALALLAGCGGDDEESSLTKAQFVQQGDAICKKQNKKKDADLTKAFREFEKKGKSSGGNAEEELIADVALPPIAEMTEELADLGLPQEQEELAGKFISEMEKAVAEVEEDPSRALEGEPFEGAKENATKLGFSACSQF